MNIGSDGLTALRLQGLTQFMKMPVATDKRQRLFRDGCCFNSQNRR